MLTQSATSVEFFNYEWLRNGGELPVEISWDSLSIADTIPVIL
jgi:hypothetical protein